MENYRSKSTREGRSNYYGERSSKLSVGPPPSMQELRSYSTSYASYVQPPPQPTMDFNKEGKFKKSKSRVDSSITRSKSWKFNDPELQRKKRVVSYKAYAVEGKMKGSLRKSFRWIKDVVHGIW
ncbi:hypothetical protein ACH5RR_007932 [Cinchona calisaya]|uniref:DUF3511 domain protein n=1 Tax=Cinchona calisaya TaxID=153742 RepID=A0ABD3ADK3_9GENT